MRVSFVMPYFFKEVSGGAEKQAYLLAKHLVKEGCDVYYLTSGKGDEIVEGIKVLRVLRLPHIFQYLEYPKILVHLFDLNPDMVITRIRHYYFPVALYGFLSFKPSIIFIPENRIPHPLYETEKVFKKRINLFKKILAVANSLLLDFFAYIGIFISKTVVIQNEKQRKFIKKIYGKESLKMSSIFEPVEVKVEEKKGICWVGNIREEKRPEILVQLAKLLPEEVFYMVGRIPERYKGSFGDLKNLKILGELEYTETVKVIANSKVYVNTSVDEGFPNTFLESWYYKTLVITFDADPDEVIAKGLGIKVKTLDEAAGVIKDFKKNPKKYEKIIQRAYNYVLENHLPQKVIRVFKERVMGLSCR